MATYIYIGWSQIRLQGAPPKVKLVIRGNPIQGAQAWGEVAHDKHGANLHRPMMRTGAPDHPNYAPLMIKTISLERFVVRTTTKKLMAAMNAPPHHPARPFLTPAARERGREPGCSSRPCVLCTLSSTGGCLRSTWWPRHLRLPLPPTVRSFACSSVRVGQATGSVGFRQMVKGHFTHEPRAVTVKL